MKEQNNSPYYYFQRKERSIIYSTCCKSLRQLFCFAQGFLLKLNSPILSLLSQLSLTYLANSLMLSIFTGRAFGNITLIHYKTFFHALFYTPKRLIIYVIVKCSNHPIQEKHFRTGGKKISLKNEPQTSPLSDIKNSPETGYKNHNFVDNILFKYYTPEERLKCLKRILKEVIDETEERKQNFLRSSHQKLQQTRLN